VRSVSSAAASVVPLPKNGSYTFSRPAARVGSRATFVGDGVQKECVQRIRRKGAEASTRPDPSSRDRPAGRNSLQCGWFQSQSDSDGRVAGATRDSLKCRRLIESEWYQARWGRRYQLAGDQNQKHRFENNRTGYRVVVAISAGTGERGDYVVVDDPHSVDQAASDTERSRAVDWWNGSMSTRLNDLSAGPWLSQHSYGWLRQTLPLQ